MRKYDDVERLGKDEVEGILNGTCYIFEKIDGANISLYCYNEKGLVICSRNAQVFSDKDGGNFRGIVEYIAIHENIRKMVMEYPSFIFYGEFLVKHVIKYTETLINVIWFFDMYNTVTNKYLHIKECLDIWDYFNVERIPILNELDNPTKEDLQQYMNVNHFVGEPQQEGIVIKNYSFINKYGRQQWAKIVNEQFKEVKKEQKGIKAEIEEKITENYITLARVNKVVNKIYDSMKQVTSGDIIKLTEKNTGEVLSRTYYDLIQEDIWEILKKEKMPIIDFKKLKKYSDNKVREYFFQILGR